jgi:molecular chaperone DnaK
MEALQQASLKLGEEVYKSTAAKGGPAPEGAAPGPEASTDRGTAAGGAKKDDDVIDAEYEVKE